MDLEKEIDTYLRARYTLVHIVSHEEDRVLGHLKSLCQRSKRSLFVWDHADFFRRITGDAADPQAAKDALSVLAAIDRADGECVFVLRDFHQCWHNQPRVIRKLRNVVQALKYTRKSIIVTAPTGAIPEELKDEAVLIELPPPNYEELSSILETLAETPGARIELCEETRGRVINLALGLSAAQAQRVFSKAIVTDGVLNEDDIDSIADEKREIIRESGALEFFNTTETINDVGGLEVLKDWLRLRELALQDDAKAYGLPPPKGIALIGIPGTGKSLTAKMVAGTCR